MAEQSLCRSNARRLPANGKTELPVEKGRISRELALFWADRRFPN